jgi:hypothetical protein
LREALGRIDETATCCLKESIGRLLHQTITASAIQFSIIQVGDGGYLPTSNLREDITPRQIHCIDRVVTSVLYILL